MNAAHHKLLLTATAGTTITFSTWYLGYIQPIFENDASKLSYAIAVLFLAGLVTAFARAFRLDIAGDVSLFTRRKQVEQTIVSVGLISDISNWLMTLGLLGTVIGFSIALAGLSADNHAGLISGLHTAVGTTIIGGFLALWNDVNRRIIETRCRNSIGELQMKRRLNIGTIFRDALLLMLLAMLVLINPPAENSDVPKPGNMIVSIGWKPGHTDVDLWVRGPGDVMAVGYSRKSDKLFNLLRDDLGNTGDTTPLNFETAVSRGLPDGEYIINLHCFACRDAQTVSVEVSMGIENMTLIYKDTVPLRHKQERTAIRFRVAGGKLVRGSQSSVFTPLRMNVAVAP